MTLSTLYLGNDGTIVYQGHAGFLGSTVGFYENREARTCLISVMKNTRDLYGGHTYGPFVGSLKFANVAP